MFIDDDDDDDIYVYIFDKAYRGPNDDLLLNLDDEERNHYLRINDEYELKFNL